MMMRYPGRNRVEDRPIGRIDAERGRERGRARKRFDELFNQEVGPDGVLMEQIATLRTKRL
jgi:hypothetical protein